MENMKCAKCGGEMEKGFIVDHTILNQLANKGTGSTISKWASKVMGIGFFSKLENDFEISSLRCKNCGYLESYAK